MFCMIALALASPLKVDIHPDGFLGLSRRARVTYPRFPVTDAEVVVDGTREALWDDVVEAPPLIPFADGRDTEITVRAAVTEDAFVVRIDPLPDTWYVSLSVDPDGSGRTYWQLQHNPNSTWLSECAHPPSEESSNVLVLPKVYPCVTVPASGPLFGRGDGGSEIAIPWADMAPATNRMRVLLKVSGGLKEGGTIAADGSGNTFSAAGVQIDRTASGASWVLINNTTAEWRLFLRNTPADANPVWTWRRSRLGDIIDEGTFDLTVADIEVLPPLESGVVVVREVGDDPIMPCFNVTVPVMEPSFALHTPVARDTIELSYSANRDANRVLTMTAPDGSLLGDAVLALPKGKGRVVVTPPSDAPEVVFIEAGAGLPPTRVRLLGR